MTFSMFLNQKDKSQVKGMDLMLSSVDTLIQSIVSSQAVGMTTAFVMEAVFPYSLVGTSDPTVKISVSGTNPTDGTATQLRVNAIDATNAAIATTAKWMIDNKFFSDTSIVRSGNNIVTVKNIRYKNLRWIAVVTQSYPTSSTPSSTPTTVSSDFTQCSVYMTNDKASYIKDNINIYYY